MKLIVFGAGAIGGLAGALMAEAGRDVVLIARGAHATAIRGVPFRKKLDRIPGSQLSSAS